MEEVPQSEHLKDVFVALSVTVLVAGIVERALAFLFEHEWFLRLFTKPSTADHSKRHSRLPGTKGLFALALSLGIASKYRFDVLHVLFETPSADAIGILITGFLIAGGSVGAITVFQSYFKFSKSTRDALVDAANAEAALRASQAKKKQAEVEARTPST